MRYLIPILLLLSLASSAHAQTTVVMPVPSQTRLAWDHDGLNATAFRVYDSAALLKEVAIGGPDLVAITGGFHTSFPALTPGVHDIYIAGVNVDLEGERSDVLRVRMAVVPNKPNNPRILQITTFGLFGRQPRTSTLVQTAYFANGAWHPEVKILGVIRS